MNCASFVEILSIDAFVFQITLTGFMFLLTSAFLGFVSKVFNTYEMVLYCSYIYNICASFSFLDDHSTTLLIIQKV
jgi:hypothetical protein